MSEEIVDNQESLSSSDNSAQSAGRVLRLFVPLAGILAVLSVIPRLFGAGLDPVSASMPADTDMYFEVDGLNLVNQDSLRIAESFQELLEEADLDFDSEDPQKLLEELDAQMFEEIGFTVEEDILPWIGPNLGVGILNYDEFMVDTFTFTVDVATPDVIAVLSVRDQTAADQFLQDLITAVAENDGDTFIESQYNGVTIYTADSTREDERIAIARAGEAMILGMNTELVQQAIDAQKGDNLASNDLYKETVNQLAEDRFLTLYISEGFYQSLFSVFQEDPAFSDLESQLLTEQFNIRSVGMSVGSTPVGLQIDAKILYDELPEFQIDYLLAQDNEISTASLLPEETVMLFSGDRLDLYWESLEEALMATGGLPAEDFDESMSLFADQFGFNPVTDLAPILDGEFAIALTESNAGAIVEQGGINMGASLIVETSDSRAMLEMVNQINTSVTQFLGVSPQPIDNPDADIFELSDPFLGGQILAYGVSSQHLVISSSDQDIAMLFEEKESLAESNAYLETWAAFPSDITPIIYFDVAGMFALFRDLDPELSNAAQLNPVSTFAMGTQYGEDVIGTTMIIFIP